MPEGQASDNAYLRIDVMGKSPKSWAELRAKLLSSLYKLIDDISEGQGCSWFEARAAEFSRAILDYAKAKLARPGIENEKTLAEVGDLYAERERKLAETRRIHAQADAQELETELKRLTIALKMTKVMLVGDPGDEAMLFGRQIDGLLAAVDQVRGESKPQTPGQLE